jgi:hypothetical protein
MVSVVDSSIADKAPAPLGKIFLRSKLPMRTSNGTAIARKARSRPSTIFAFVPPYRGRGGIALGALKHPIKVGGRKI